MESLVFSDATLNAIDDGKLVPVDTYLSRTAGINQPVFLSRLVWDKYVSVPEQLKLVQNETGRLWDILTTFRQSAKNSQRPEIRFGFICQLPDAGNWDINEHMLHGSRSTREVKLKAICSDHFPDESIPAIFIKHPNE
jgi:hypothetical protein